MAKDHLGQLWQIILQDPDSFARKQALMEIYRYDDARVTDLLRHVSEKDDDHGVRELAKNLYGKRQLIDAAPGASFAVDASAAAPVSVGELMQQASPEYTAHQNPASGTMFLFDSANTDFVRGRAARPPRISWRSLTCGVLFISIFVLVGIGAVLFAIYEYDIWRRLDEYGVTANGVFTGRHISSGEDSDSYYVDYRFVYNNEMYTGREQVEWDFYNRTQTGAPTTLVLLPDDPTTSRIAGYNERRNFPMIFAVIWNSIVGLFLLIGFFVMRSHNKLMREGRVVHGRVIEAHGHTDSDNNYIVSVKYDFIAPDTQEVINGYHSQTLNSLRNAPLPQPDNTVAVMYRNKRHHRLL